jgi:3-hydroxybutyryl-CoA dehydrogenase
MVQGGFLGQKTKRGWYEYVDGQRVAQATAAAAPAAALRSAVVASDSALGAELAEALRAAKVNVTLVPIDDGPIDIATLISYAGAPDVVVDACTGSPLRRRALIQALGDAPGNAPVLSMAVTVGATEVASWSRDPELVCGFGYVPPLADSQVVEIAPALQSGPVAVEAAHRLAATLNREPIVLRADAPGLIGPRIVSLIANEAAFALMEGVASRDDIDTAVRLGANYPFGPLEWADRIGIDQIYATIYALFGELSEDRYRPAPLLRRMYRAGWFGRSAGRGFYTYETS